MRILVFLFLSSFFVFPLYAQDSTSQVITPPGLDLSTPKDYKIADITVSGAKFLDAGAIVSLTGLKIGDKIIVNDITFHKCIIGLVFYIYKVLKIPRIS